MKGSSSNFQ